MTLLPVVSVISSLSLFTPPQDSFEVSFTPAPVGPPANRSEVQGGKTETVKQTNTELRGTYAGVLWMGLLQLTLLNCLSTLSPGRRQCGPTCRSV